MRQFYRNACEGEFALRFSTAFEREEMTCHPELVEGRFKPPYVPA